MKTNTKWIDGLKGFACLMIMFGHFWEVYLLSPDFAQSFWLLDRIAKSRVGFLIDEGFWLFLFFFVSGYLVARSEISGVTQLIKKSVLRFLRFAIPIFFSMAVVFLLTKAFEFHNAETIELFKNNWYQEFYANGISLGATILSPIRVLLLGDASINAPYWVLREMLVASVVIYTISYLRKQKLHWLVQLVVLVVVLYVTMRLSKTVYSCVFGAGLYYYEEHFQRIKVRIYYLVVSVALFALNIIPRSTLIFSNVLVFFPHVAAANRILSSAMFTWLGKISWGIYSFHWPLMCAAGAGLMLFFAEIAGLGVAYWIAFALVAFATILIAWLYSVSVEKVSDRLYKKIAAWVASIKPITS